jgi:hypothetical protein
MRVILATGEKRPYLVDAMGLSGQQRTSPQFSYRIV